MSSISIRSPRSRVGASMRWCAATRFCKKFRALKRPATVTSSLRNERFRTCRTRRPNPRLTSLSKTPTAFHNQAQGRFSAPWVKESPSPRSVEPHRGSTTGRGEGRRPGVRSATPGSALKPRRGFGVLPTTLRRRSYVIVRVIKKLYNAHGGE